MPDDNKCVYTIHANGGFQVVLDHPMTEEDARIATKFYDDTMQCRVKYEVLFEAMDIVNKEPNEDNSL